jgi:hypothetical protein
VTTYNLFFFLDLNFLLDLIDGVGARNINSRHSLNQKIGCRQNLSMTCESRKELPISLCPIIPFSPIIYIMHTCLCSVIIPPYSSTFLPFESLL